MKNLFFDLETTSLVPKGANYKTDFDKFPHVVQIAWDLDGVENDFIIKPNGYEIPEESTKIHGITHDYAVKNGIDAGIVFALFVDDAIRADNVIGHNLYFDTSVLKANFLKLGLEMNFIDSALDKHKRICTMVKSNKFMGLKQVGSNRPKYPSLVELYTRLFKEDFNAHNAMEDVRATKRCFFGLAERKIINI